MFSPPDLTKIFDELKACIDRENTRGVEIEAGSTEIAAVNTLWAVATDVRRIAVALEEANTLKREAVEREEKRRADNVEALRAIREKVRQGANVSLEPER